MKHLLILILLLINICSSKAQQQDSYDLNWKIGDKERLAYWAMMEQVDSAKTDTPDLSEKLNVEEGEELNLKTFFEKFYKELNKGQENLSLVVVLEGKQDWVKAFLIRENFNSEQDSSSIMFKGVQLRGMLNQNGAIESFYTKRNQKNLLAMFFQLPSQAVKVGDKWNLDVNLLTANHNFEVDSLQRTNEVELLEVRVEEADTVAVLKYNIEEEMYGHLIYGVSWQEPVATSYSMKYQAIAEFSISSGRWLNYEGLVHVRSTGFQNVEYKQRYGLIAIEGEVPKQVIQYLEVSKGVVEW